MANPKKKTPEDLESLCRAFTKSNVQKLGGFATSDQVEPDIQIRAIGMLLDRGWGRPKQTHDANISGAIEIVMRDIAAEKAKNK